ncbi:hypothetical protein MmrVgp49 [Harp seal herpesvirus]|uniref:Uncharacterized protein n=1 Tax=phocid gammaherpesvirus 3 TaxID=2560643 RepID=A0A0R5YYD6_9GAMA|nr:hypothetical protein MmrVgp49 [Harp seal herpesvirus]AJG42973.1 hypothetical protein MmrVgp49 [Harp seal herpesvirus]
MSVTDEVRGMITFFQQLKNYYIFPKNVVLCKYNSISSGLYESPLYRKQLLGIQKNIFLVKICDVLIRNKQNEHEIVHTLLYKVNAAMLELEKQVRQGYLRVQILALRQKNISEATQQLLFVLRDVKREKYPHENFIENLFVNPSHYLKWCESVLTGLKPHMKTDTLYSLTGKNEVFSLSFFNNLSKKLYRAENYVNEPDMDVNFNIVYNQVVLWTAASKLYENVIKMECIDEHITDMCLLLENKMQNLIATHTKNTVLPHYELHIKNIMSKVSCLNYTSTTENTAEILSLLQQWQSMLQNSQEIK